MHIKSLKICPSFLWWFLWECLNAGRLYYYLIWVYPFLLNVNLWETKCFFFTIAMYFKYAWVIFVLKDGFKSWNCYFFCTRIKLTASQNIKIFYYILPYFSGFCLRVHYFHSKGFTNFRNSLLSFTFFIFNFS